MIKSLQILLHRFGLELRRIDNYHLKPNREVQIQLGRYSLAINTRNPLSIYYDRYPDYNRELGPLAAALNAKYPGAGVIDIGANVGDTAALIKNAADVPIVCIEGDAYVFGFLERNIAQFRDVRAFRQFLGDKDEVIPARREKDHWNTTIIPDAGGSEKLELLRLDTFLERQKLSGSFKLLKTDTEGFDVKILRGASKLLDRDNPVINLEYNRHNMDAIGEKGIDTLFWLRDKGYEDVLVYEDSSRFICSARLSDTLMIEQLHRWVGDSREVNYLDLTLMHRDDGDVARRLVESESHDK